MQFRDILYTVDEGVATIALNRPETLNAVTPRMMQEVLEALKAAEGDEGVRVVVITGRGRAFCAGANPRALLQQRELGEPPNRLSYQMTLALWRFPRPTIAAVNGPAVGGGMDLASACDLRLASEQARFSMGYVRMGLIPGQGGLWLLPRLVGLANALDLIWTGRAIDAGEALRLGYVQAVYPHEDFPQAVADYARRLAHGPSVAINTAKRLAYRFLTLPDLEEALRVTEEAMREVSATEDAREGPLAWLEKRRPRFKGR